MWWHYTPIWWILWFFGATDEQSIRYGFWSGIGIAAFLPLTYYFHHICHEHRCFRMGHPSGHVVKCKKHANW